MRERLRREKYDQRSNKRRRILDMGTLENNDNSGEGKERFYYFYKPILTLTA